LVARIRSGAGAIRIPLDGIHDRLVRRRVSVNAKSNLPAPHWISVGGKRIPLACKQKAPVRRRNPDDGNRFLPVVDQNLIKRAGACAGNSQDGSARHPRKCHATD
jgi:hypothetical protein